MSLSYNLISKKIILKITTVIGLLVFMYPFQNCEMFGGFESVDTLSSTDPHQDSWTVDQGLEVKNGEWSKVESQILEKYRLSDRSYMSSKLQSLAIFGNPTSNTNKNIHYQINKMVASNFRAFGGPCEYSNPEEFLFGDSSKTDCKGIDIDQVYAELIPSPNIFRSANKNTICDFLAYDTNVQNNIRQNIILVSQIVDSQNVPYLIHQIFYLGQTPRKRTLASLEDLYRVTSSLDATADLNQMYPEGLKALTLVLCHSNGWESN